MTGKELYFIAEAHFQGCLAGDGPFTERCHKWIESRTGCSRALLTHSCTAALEMAALLLEVKQGDEVIMPSYLPYPQPTRSCCAGQRRSSWMCEKIR